MGKCQPETRPVVVGRHLTVAFVDGGAIYPTKLLGELTAAGLMEAAERLREIWRGKLGHEDALQKLRAAWRLKTNQELMPDNMVGL